MEKEWLRLAGRQWVAGRDWGRKKRLVVSVVRGSKGEKRSGRHQWEKGCRPISPGAAVQDTRAPLGLL